MAIRRRIHAGQVYLGREVLRALGVRDGDEVEIEVRGREVVLRPIETVDRDTRELLEILEKPQASGGREDYFEEYDYGDIGG